jgi:hypothetical protein
VHTWPFGQSELPLHGEGENTLGLVDGLTEGAPTTIGGAWFEFFGAQKLGLPATQV